MVVEDRPQPLFFHIECPRYFRQLSIREAFGRAFGKVHGSRVNLKSEPAQCGDFPENERVSDGGVTANQVG